MKLDKSKTIDFIKSPKLWIVISILLITIISSISLLKKGIAYGHDIMYHLSRIQGISESLKQRRHNCFVAL